MKRLLTSLSLILASLVAGAQEPVQLSLQDCFRYALQHADTIKNVRLNYRLQQEQNDQIKASALPHINGNIAYTHFINQQQTLIPSEIFGGPPGTYQALPFTPKYASTTGISGSQAIFDGQLLVALKARKTILELVRQSASLTEEGLKYNIQRAYFSMVVARRQFSVLAQSLGTARQMMHEAEATYNAGFIEKIDVSRATVQLNNLEADSIRTASLLESGEQLLKYQMGMPINEPIILTDTSLNEQLLQASELGNERLDYTARTEYNLLQTSRRLNEAYIQRYKLAALPTIGFNGNLGYNYSSNAFADLTRFRKNYLFSSYISFNVNVPIFNGLLRQHQLQEARINLEKTDNNIHFLKQSLDFADAQAKTALRNAMTSLEKTRRTVELSNTVLDLAHKKFQAGVGSSLEVNTAQTDLLLSQNNYFQALLDVISAQADVQRALGLFK